MFSENLLEKRSKEFLELAKGIAQKQGDRLVDTDHLLVAMISKKDSPIVKILEKGELIQKILEKRWMSI